MKTKEIIINLTLKYFDTLCSVAVGSTINQFNQPSVVYIHLERIGFSELIKVSDRY